MTETSKEVFESRMKYFYQLSLVYSGEPDYASGMLEAFGFWYIYKGTFRDKYRHVVAIRKDAVKGLTKDIEEHFRGYDDAMRILQEAKNL